MVVVEEVVVKDEEEEVEVLLWCCCWDARNKRRAAADRALWLADRAQSPVLLTTTPPPQLNLNLVRRTPSDLAPATASGMAVDGGAFLAPNPARLLENCQRKGCSSLGRCRRRGARIDCDPNEKRCAQA